MWCLTLPNIYTQILNENNWCESPGMKHETKMPYNWTAAIPVQYITSIMHVLRCPLLELALLVQFWLDPIATQLRVRFHLWGVVCFLMTTGSFGYDRSCTFTYSTDEHPATSLLEYVKTLGLHESWLKIRQMALTLDSPCLLAFNIKESWKD